MCLLQSQPRAENAIRQFQSVPGSCWPEIIDIFPIKKKHKKHCIRFVSKNFHEKKNGFQGTTLIHGGGAQGPEPERCRSSAALLGAQLCRRMASSVSLGGKSSRSPACHHAVSGTSTVKCSGEKGAHCPSHLVTAPSSTPCCWMKCSALVTWSVFSPRPLYLWCSRCAAKNGPLSRHNCRPEDVTLLNTQR